MRIEDDQLVSIMAAIIVAGESAKRPVGGFSVGDAEVREGVKTAQKILDIANA